MLRVALNLIVKQFTVSKDNPELVKAQFMHFATQVPIMYSVLLINTWALAINYYGAAPNWLSIYAPSVFAVICIVRMTNWLKQRKSTPQFEKAHATLVRTNKLAGIFTLMLTAWSLLLYPYGDIYMQAHVAFFMAITGVGVIICMQQLRSAAFIIALSVNIPFAIFFGTSGIASFVIIAGNMALVTIALVTVTVVQSRAFADTIDSQIKLELANKENEKLANLDSLTGLTNRRQFFTKLQEEFRIAEREDKRLAVGIIDLNGFKLVNDHYGHAFGDSLLMEVGARLEELSSKNVSISRLGGDEFALVISDNNSDEQLKEMGQQIRDALSVPFVAAEITVQISGSIGFAVYPYLAKTSLELYERADYALYQSKNIHNGEVVVFTERHILEIEANTKTEYVMSKADLDKEIVVYFQPIIDIHSSRTVAFEALARWESPVLGKVSPADFIPIAEKTGLINKLTQVLLKKSLAMAATWPEGIKLSFNLSTHDINSPQAVREIMNIIQSHGFDPSRIDLEITETAAMRDFDQAKSSVKILKSLGCGIVLDDFGTGFSSLSHLHALPLTKIKIDRSFVSNIDTVPASFKIVKSLLSLSRDMGLLCVVEGVETQEELSVIESLGGQLVQGYFFSAPISEIEIDGFLQETALPKRA